jgi:SAM-dependent methyltransferase
VHIGVLHPSRESALQCPAGPIALAHCAGCDLVFNPDFDSNRVAYSQRYDNSLFFSPTFQKYSWKTARRLIDTYDIRGKRVLEIGAGSGDFLRLLVETGDNQGIGIDPASRTESSGSTSIVFLAEPFEQHHLAAAPDLICSRYVLEHLPRPLELLSTIRKGLESPSKTVLYFEVPHAFLVLRNLSIWDIIYEHCAYYTPLALANLFRRAGFGVLRIEETYGGQFIAVDASPDREPPVAVTVNSSEETQRLISEFEVHYRTRVESWRQRVEQLSASRSRVILWGAGAKGVSLLNLLPMGELVSYVVDVNPAKHGCYVPGTGQPIMAPEHVRKSPPELVILTNPLYEAEIRQQIASLGVETEFALA